MNVFEEATLFAIEAHKGQTRKMSNTPYILHPLEVAAIAGTMTDELEVLAAAVLHDTVEDCNVDPYVIRDKFGSRVYALVMAETEDKMLDISLVDSWKTRKQDSLIVLENTKDRGVKILWLSDKLSNMRSFYRESEKSGGEFLTHLHQKDPKMQYWYFDSIAKLLESELGDTDAYKEYVYLLNKFARNVGAI